MAVSGYPILLEGDCLDALVVGGGATAARKVAALIDSGARVRVVAPVFCADLRERAATCSRLTLVERTYESTDVHDAHLVFAATDVRTVNAQVTTDAHAAGCFVNVVDAPDDGDFVTPAVHRSGPLVIAVSAGGVPTAAARIRDAIATRFDGRFAGAIQTLGTLRRRLLAAGDKAGWHAVEAAVIDDSFPRCVEDGTFDVRLTSWNRAAVPDSARSTWP